MARRFRCHVDKRRIFVYIEIKRCSENCFGLKVIYDQIYPKETAIFKRVCERIIR